MESFIFDESLLEASGMSEYRSMDETRSGQNFGEHFVEILRASGMNEELLPDCNEINEGIGSMPGSEEFIEWFTNIVTVFNVVSEEELKVNEELKDVPIEEVNSFLEQTLGDQQDKCPVAKEMIDHLVAEEAMCRTQLEATLHTKELLQSKLNATAEQKKSLLHATNQIKQELRSELNSVTDLYQDTKTKCEKLLEEFNNYIKSGDINEGEDTVEEQNLISRVDLSKFYELNKLVTKEFKETLAHYVSFTDVDEQKLRSAIAMNLNKNKGVESEGQEEANGLVLQYLNSKIKSEEKKVEFISIFSLLAQQSQSCNQIVSFLYETEVKQTNVTLTLIKKLLSSLKAIFNIEIPRSKFDSKSNDELVLAANLQKWNEILTGSNDFVTIEQFVESLKEFDQKLTNCESNMNAYLSKLNQSTAELINKVNNSLMEMNKKLEGPTEVSCIKQLRSYIEIIYESSEQLKKLKIEAEKKESSLSLYENALLNGLTDYQGLLNKIEDIERKVKLLECASKN